MGNIKQFVSAILSSNAAFRQPIFDLQILPGSSISLPMSLTNLTSQDLTKIVRLIERKESIKAQLAEIDQQLSAIEGGSSSTTKAPAATPKRRGRKPKAIATAEAPTASTTATPGKRGPKKKAVRGQLKQGITQALQAAGRGGLSIKELADKLGAKFKNISIWFYTTGKTIPEIKKIDTGRYAWVK